MSTMVLFWLPSQQRWTTQETFSPNNTGGTFGRQWFIVPLGLYYEGIVDKFTLRYYFYFNRTNYNSEIHAGEIVNNYVEHKGRHWGKGTIDGPAQITGNFSGWHDERHNDFPLRTDTKTRLPYIACEEFGEMTFTPVPPLNLMSGR